METRGREEAREGGRKGGRLPSYNGSLTSYDISNCLSMVIPTCHKAVVRTGGDSLVSSTQGTPYVVIACWRISY